MPAHTTGAAFKGREANSGIAYNRSVKLSYLCVLPVFLLLLGCNRGNQTPEAVRQGVIDYLAKRSDLDMSSMQIDVTSVSFRQNEADATVSFRPKGSGAGSGMQMRYTLERQGNRWVVKGRGQSAAGAAPHGGNPGQMPGAPGGMQQPGSGPMGGALPPGHPPMSGSKPPEPQKK